jgi:hypothetical protein
MHETERLLFWIFTEQRRLCFGFARNKKVFVLDLRGTERPWFRIYTKQKGFCFGSAPNRKALVSNLHGTERLLFRICTEQKGSCFWICTERKGFCFGSAQNGKSFDTDAQKFYGQAEFLTYSLLSFPCQTEIEEKNLYLSESMKVYLWVFLACLPACLDGRREESTGEKKLVRRKIPIQVNYSSRSPIFTYALHKLKTSNVHCVSVIRYRF